MLKSSRYVEKKISADSCHFVDKKSKNPCDTWNHHKTKLPQHAEGVVLMRNITPSFSFVSCRIRYVWQTWCISALASLGCPVVGSKSCCQIWRTLSCR